MGVRAIQARIYCDHAILECLWRTHRVFNERLLPLLSLLFKMRRGELGSTDELRKLYQEIALFILARDSKHAPYLLNSVSIKNWKPDTARKMDVVISQGDGAHKEFGNHSWVDKAAELSANGQLLYDKKQLLGDLPETLQQMIARECVAILKGHFELVRKWERDHEEWLERKATWESDPDHRQYLALRGSFEAFEHSGAEEPGKLHGRWRRYVNWLSDHPGLAAWRGGPAYVNALSTEARQRIDRTRPTERASVEADEFWQANPELRELDKLHGYYEREFIRRRKVKKNPDGFDHRPTFILPHPLLHPRWYVFNAPQTKPRGYIDLSLPQRHGSMGSVQLRVLTGEKTDGKYPSDWVSVRFKADPRLADFRTVETKRTIQRGAHKWEQRDSQGFMFFDRRLRLDRNALISGARLVFKNIRTRADGSLVSADSYLIFACDVRNVPLTERARKIPWSETGEASKTGKRQRRKTLPEGLTLCSVDLGIRSLGFATLTRLEHGVPCILRSRNIWIGLEEKKGRHPGRWSAGPGFAHLVGHRNEIRRLQRLSGKPAKGEESHIGLQNHITSMSEDRFKKSARAIINFALNTDLAFSKVTGEVYPRADVLILEKTKEFIPDGERETGINRALVEWNRGQTVQRVQEMARGVGLKVIQVSPAGSSQVCSRCGSLGRRYAVVRDETSGRPMIRFGWAEKLFACAACGYRANADHNASVNLHRRFAHEDQAVNRFVDWRSKSKREREEAIKCLEAKLRGPLEVLHGLVFPEDGK